MGLFSWVSGNVQKSKVAATIQQYFEFARRLGSFPGDPALMANRVVELAFNRVPDLASGRLKGYVMATTVLSIIVLENDLPLEVRDHCAVALAGMLKLASKESHLHSYNDQSMLETARNVLAQFREQVPSPLMSEVMKAPATPSSESHSESAESFGAQSVLSREEALYVHAYAHELGHPFGLRGFSEFVEAKTGVLSIALGVMSNEKELILGTVVVVAGTPHSSISVRDFQSKPMPGPKYYSNIYAALVSTRPYFDKLAELAAKRAAADDLKVKRSPHLSTRSTATPSSKSPSEGVDTSQERQRRMDELIRRMK